MRLVPRSNKARVALEKSMGGDSAVRLEKRTGNKVLVSSESGYCVWVDLSGDPNWDLVL